ncbi:MAG: prepilin-type N-terminal cleavage/methylation domain-containing protein [Planctomycetes bacterium]|nr:prepilin-type N-terminal cleavage/methylation domain-containing protein [Planctomycetota bacterium]
MHSKHNRGFTLVELMVVIAILGLLVSVLAFTVVHQYAKSKADLEKIAMKDIVSGINQMTIDQRAGAILRAEPNRNAGGREFFKAAFKSKLLDESLLKKIVSQSGNDFAADALPSEGAELLAENCSFTAPKMGELREVMGLGGKKRVVLLSHNGRNWRNYESLGYGPLVIFSDGDMAQYLDPQTAQAEMKLSSADWEDPSANLFGRKQPFQRTYE